MLIFDAALSSEERKFQGASLLSKKWGLTAKVDSDNDGFTDAVEYQLSSSAVDAASAPAGVPAALSKATLWLDANDASTIDRDRYNNVNTWSDKSGSGVELSASTISGLVVYDPINAGINFNYQGMSSTNDFDAKHIYVVHKTVDELNYFVDLRKPSDNLPNAYFVPKFGKTWFNKVAVNGLGTTNDTLIHDNTLQVSKLSGPSSDTVNFSLYQRYKTFTDEPGKGTAYEVIAFDQDLTNEEEVALYTYFMNKWELSNVAIDTDGDGVTDTADAFPNDETKSDPEIDITSPTVGEQFAIGTTTVGVTISQTVSSEFSGGWQVQLDAAFTVGEAGAGSTVAAANAANIAITEGAHVIHVALVDSSGTVLATTQQAVTVLGETTSNIIYLADEDITVKYNRW